MKKNLSILLAAILVIGMLVVIGIAISNVETPTEKIDKVLKGIKFTINAEDQAAISAAIQRGKDAANRVHALEKAIETANELEAEVAELLASLPTPEISGP